ncbi:MAG: hypothetical protein R3C42_00170 [Parvularculaceae bacterium]
MFAPTVFAPAVLRLFAPAARPGLDQRGGSLVKPAARGFAQLAARIANAPRRSSRAGVSFQVAPALF